MEQSKYNTETRKWKQISEKERYKIEALFEQGLTPAQIGKALTPNRDRRTIERERNIGLVEQKRINPSFKKSENMYIVEWIYKADVAQRRHTENAANKGRGLKIGNDHKLSKYIEDKIVNEKYSPDAVIGEIKEQGLKFETNICTKTLYNYIENNIFMNISNKNLPVKKNRKKRKYRQVRSVALNNTKGLSIDERPKDIENRTEKGHWEMDCVVGKGKACLLVLTERVSRRELIFKMKAKTQKCVIEAIDKLERKHRSKFAAIFKSITMDNGCEFLDFTGIEKSMFSNKPRTKCYYAHPYCAWERGSNEVANKLIRRFVPKGYDIGKLTVSDVKRIEYWLNNYPRRIFGYKTANQIYAA